jgi:hypothetical protein
MKASDIQQCVSGFKTVGIYSGPFTVRVHECQDALALHSPHRYCISVNFKFREFDALNSGNLGWYGVTKSEATRDAKALCEKLTALAEIVNRAEAKAGNGPNERITFERQNARLQSLLSKYTAEFI